MISTPDLAPAAVPFLDLAAQYEEVGREVGAAMKQVAASGTYVLGPQVALFEREFAAAHGVEHCVGVNTGTSALHLALLASGVGPGDEVITVPMTFIATSWAISYCGATPVFVDIDPVTYTMDPDQVASRITPRTRAILPVHLYGQPADLEPLLKMAGRYGIPLIEDAAQAHLARYRGRLVGGFGTAAGFSFYPGKNLGAMGEAGAVVTGDANLAARIRVLRDHAQTQRYHHAEIGFNYRMDALQGAVLRVKLKHLEGWTEARRRVAARYLRLLKGLPVQLPTVSVGMDPAWHLFVILVRSRDRVQKELDSRGIQTGLHYPTPLHLQPAYRFLGYQAGEFPVAERVGRECLSLPIYPELTDAQQDRIVSALADALREEE